MGSTDTPLHGAANTLKVAVVIPAWNAEQTIARAVQSALSQTEPCHVIVVDDASSDATIATAEETAAATHHTGKFTILRQSKNGGPSAARNRGIDLAQEPWIALLDADDFMTAKRVATLLMETKAHDFVADDLYRVVEGATDGPCHRLIQAEDFTPFDLDFETFVLGNIHGARGDRGELGFLKPLMRKDSLDRHNLRYNEITRLGEDYELYARALARGVRMRVTNPLGYFAVERSVSLSAQHSASDLGRIVEIDRALLATEMLTPNERRSIWRHLGPIRREWAWMRLIDAVKARAPGAALRCFAGPPDIALSLCAKLLEQAVLRASRSVTDMWRS